MLGEDDHRFTMNNEAEEITEDEETGFDASDDGDDDDDEGDTNTDETYADLSIMREMDPYREQEEYSF